MRNMIAGGMLAIALAVGAVILPAAAPAVAGTNIPAQNHPLDCIHWTITDNGGTGPRTRWLVCSSIPKDQGGDSPARDSTNWHHYVVDGGPAYQDPSPCPTWANPCVMF